MLSSIKPSEKSIRIFCSYSGSTILYSIQDYGLDSLPPAAAAAEPVYGNIETASAVSHASYVSETPQQQVRTPINKLIN